MAAGSLAPGNMDSLPLVDSDDPTACAGILKILADETRLAVLQQLLNSPQHVGDINASLGIEQSLLSHHLRVLREAGLVTARRDGKHVLYSIAKEVVAPRGRRAIDLGCCQISFQ